MALNVDKETPVSADTASTTQIRSIGFSSGFGLMGTTRGSEYTNAIAKTMTDAFANTPIGVHVFDNERMSNLSYSCIVTSLQGDPSEAGGVGPVCYHVALLEATGMDPLKAADIVAEATRHSREPSTQARIFTPSDAIDAVLNDIILTELSKKYGMEPEYISTEGVVVHECNLELGALGICVAAVGHNSVVTEAELSAGKFGDLNLVEALSNKGRNQIRMECNTYPTTIQNLLGSPVRQDFKLDLVDVSSDAGFSLNEESRTRIASIGGYIDAIREDIPMMAQPGMPQSYMSRLHPNIVITNVDGLSPTQGFNMLGIGAGTAMSRPELWLSSLLGIDPKGLNNPGALNILTNIEGGKAGTVLDFSSKKVTQEEHLAVLRQMYSQSPVVSVDVEVHGPAASYSAMLAVAASNGKGSRAALQDIVSTCVQLTNGNFPKDFDINNIFASQGLVIPMGYWMDKSGERDIRDIDLAFVANRTGDINTVNKWSASSLPNSGLDSFLTRVEIIASLIPDAVISGKAVRATFTAAFLATLTDAIEATGMVARFESTLVMNEQYNPGQYTDYLAAAGLSSPAGFAQQYGGHSAGIQTQFPGMGQWRY